MPEDDDPRQLLARSFDQARSVVRGVKDSELSAPTPCDEFDVAVLMNHLIGGIDRAGRIAKGEAISDELIVRADTPPDGFEAAVAAAADASLEAWQDGALLDKEFTLPWGTWPGAMILRMYAMEAILHTWDLAVATGQDHKLDDSVFEEVFPFARQMLGNEARGREVPFGAALPVPPDAPPADQLAAFTGRKRPRAG